MLLHAHPVHVLFEDVRAQREMWSNWYVGPSSSLFQMTCSSNVGFVSLHKIYQQKIVFVYIDL